MTSKFERVLGYLCAAMIGFGGFCGLVVGTFPQMGWSKEPVKGPLAPIFGGVALIFAIYMVIVLRKEARQQKGK